MGARMPANLDASPVIPGAPNGGLAVPGSAADRNSRRASGNSARQDGEPRSSQRNEGGMKLSNPNTRKSQVRHALAHSGWYHSPPAEWLREVLHGKTCALVMV